MKNNHNIPEKPDKPDVESMFDSIAWRYDFLNHFLSFGIDLLWRKRTIRLLSGRYMNPEILDIATGTGDLAISAMSLDPAGITGIDISEKMLEIAAEKIRRKGYDDRIRLIKCDSGNLVFEENTFDIAMVAFGVRNFPDPLKGLSEMHRVLKNGGSVVVLEFSRPSVFPFSQVYDFYFRHILPGVGKLISKDRKAYRYLYDSVSEFPDNELFINILAEAGFSGIMQAKLTFGAASIYSGVKN